MKKYLITTIAIVTLLGAQYAFGADVAFLTFLTGLTSKSTPAATDVFYLGDIAGGTVSKKLTFANLEASLNLTNLTGTLGVSQGGTGKTTLTSGQLLFGSGTGVVGSVATSTETCTSPLSCSSHSVVGSGGGAITIANSVADGATKGAASFTAADFDASSGNISIDYTNGQKATGSVPGFLTAADWTTFNGKGAGTVTAVSVASANGLAGSSSGGATPQLTLSTSITGVLKGNGTAISAAANGTDYSLISALSCSAGQHLATVNASGTFTCTADSGGGGGGGGGGTFSTSTNPAYGGVFNNYANNATDIVEFGGISGTSTAKFWFDPNSNFSALTGTSTITGSLGIGTSTTMAPLSVQSMGGSDQNKLQSWAYGPDLTNSRAYNLILKQTTSSGVVRWVFDQKNNSVNYPNVFTFDRGAIGIGTTTPYRPLSVAGFGGVAAERFEATSTNATSTIAGSLIIGNGLYGGQIPPVGFLGTTGNPQVLVENAINDGTSLLTIANTGSGDGTLTNGCISFANSRTPFVGGVSADYNANICYSSPTWNAFPGQQPNGLAIYNVSGDTVIAALSSNFASSSVNIAAGPGFSSGNFDFRLTNVDPSVYPNNVGFANLGLGSTTPNGRLVITSPSNSGIPFFLVASSTGGTNSTVGTLPQQTIFQITANGIASTTNLNISSITGTQCLHAIAGVVSGTGSDCGSGGGSQTPWTSDIAGAGFNLTGVGQASTTNIIASNPVATSSFAGIVNVGSISAATNNSAQMLVTNALVRTNIMSWANSGGSSMATISNVGNFVTQGFIQGSNFISTGGSITCNVATCSVGGASATAGANATIIGGLTTTSFLTLRGNSNASPLTEYIRFMGGPGGGDEEMRVSSSTVLIGNGAKYNAPAKLAVIASSTAAFPLFDISGPTTAGIATTSLFKITADGVQTGTSTTPTISGTNCGSSPTGIVIGGQNWGKITVGGTATACTINFNGAFTSIVSCVISNESASVTNAMTYSISGASSMTINQAVGLSGNIIHYRCDGI